MSRPGGVSDEGPGWVMLGCERAAPVQQDRHGRTASTMELVSPDGRDLTASQSDVHADSTPFESLSLLTTDRLTGLILGSLDE